jgi:hypothetical protein
MKVFRLSCGQGHDFEGWFASSEAFDLQRAGGEIACPLCESRQVERLPSAPYVNTGARGSGALPAVAGGKSVTADLGAALAAIKAHVLANTEDVGTRFPEVARSMHYGEESERGIRGRVTAQEANDLREEGIEAVVLPPILGLDGKVH